MKTLHNILWIGLMVFTSFQSLSQGAIRGLNNPNLSDDVPSCGSYHFMNHQNSESFNFLDYSNGLLENAVEIAQNKSRNYNELLVIPVVFHIVYSNEQQNLSDEVILNQLEILNQAFRRQNTNASETRPVFLDLVGDTKIEFRLAEIDPNGTPTTGITRTETSITHFGGILPYASNQTNEIEQWVNDSLYYNWFRITETGLGGSDAWDTHTYLNIWIGDLGIFEPLVNNFEELVFIGLATPPIDHPNWPQDIVEPLLGYNQGVLMHYVAVGDNNPNSFPQPYQNLNNPVKKGKVLVHEVGHFLGLRHIWGDGNCSMDDFIADTPNASNHSNWGCSHNVNSCVDNINGVDLPNMVENYMDYSSGNCQNSFTIGQADVMRSVLEIYRPFLAESIPTTGINSFSANELHTVYPNPTSGEIYISNTDSKATYHLFDLSGKLIITGNLLGHKLNLEHLNNGCYILELHEKQQINRIKIIKK